MIKTFISVTSHALDPLSVTNCHTFSGPLPPLERDVLYGRPLRRRLGVAMGLKYFRPYELLFFYAYKTNSVRYVSLFPGFVEYDVKAHN